MEWNGLTDRIETETSAFPNKDLKEVRSLVNYSISYGNSASCQFSWLMLLLLVSYCISFKAFFSKSAPRGISLG